MNHLLLRGESQAFRMIQSVAPNHPIVNLEKGITPEGWVIGE